MNRDWCATIPGMAKNQTWLKWLSMHTRMVNIRQHQYYCAAAAAAKSLQSCPTLCDPIDGSPQGSRHWDSPGKNTGVGCHFLLQCMKMKSESEVAQSCSTLSDPMDCSLPGSSAHGIFQARVLEWGAIAFSNLLYSKGKFFHSQIILLALVFKMYDLWINMHSYFL